MTQTTDQPGTHPRQRRARWRALVPWAVLTLTLLPATLILWYPGLQTTHDGFYHKSRLLELDILLRSGVLYPRWLPHVSFFYGSPVLHFYAPFIYYVAEGFRLLGWGYLSAYEWMIGLGIVAAGWTMFAFARRWGTLAGWLAAVVYVYWPYHMALAYVRGAQAELWAMVWYPVLLIGVRDWAEEQKGWVDPRLALAYTALIITHHLSAFEFTPVLVAYALWRAWLVRRRDILVRAGLSLALGVGLSAFYWLPVLADIRLVWAGRPSDVERMELLQNLVPLSDIFSPFWVHRYHPFQSVKAASPLPRVGTTLWLVGLGLTLLRWRALPRERRWQAIFFAALVVAGAFMLTIYSRFIWATVPLIHYLQFPWRLHSIIGLGAGLTVALGLGSALDTWWARGPRPALDHALVGLPIVAALALAALPGIRYDVAKEPKSNRPLREEDVNLALLASYDYLRGLSIREFKGIWLFEYMPIWSAQSREEFFLPPASPPPDVPPLNIRVMPEKQHPLRRTFRVQSDTPWTFALHQFYFPAWEIHVDGRRVSTRPQGPLGLLAADIPAGEHTVRVVYGHTRAQRVAEVISLVSAGVWLVLVWRGWRRLLWVPALMALYLLVATAPAWAGGRGSITPQQQDILLGDRIRLVGSYVPKTTVRPGEQVWFSLYWLALAPPQARYKVIVHMTDEGGNPVAVGDTEPGFFFTPTTRWEQGELMEDWYTVRVPEDLPPGRYLLLTGMYDLETVQNLPIQGGTQVGGRVLVGEVTVVP